jgi:hypothetical protein
MFSDLDNTSLLSPEDQSKSMISMGKDASSEYKKTYTLE